MTVVEIINRGYHFGQLIKKGFDLKSYETVPFSSLTARSDHAVNDRFTPEANEYTPAEARFIEMLLSRMSNSAERTARAPALARMNLTD